MGKIIDMFTSSIIAILHHRAVVKFGWLCEGIFCYKWLWDCPPNEYVGFMQVLAEFINDSLRRAEVKPHVTAAASIS